MAIVVACSSYNGIAVSRTAHFSAVGTHDVQH